MTNQGDSIKNALKCKYSWILTAVCTGVEIGYYFVQLVREKITFKQFLKKSVVSIVSAAAATVAGIAGGFGGGFIGAAIGSAIPGIGTAIGAAIGAIIGGVACGASASYLTSTFMENLFFDELDHY